MPVVSTRNEEASSLDDASTESCRKYRLRDNQYFIDHVTVYVSDSYGIEALRFQVGDLG